MNHHVFGIWGWRMKNEEWRMRNEEWRIKNEEWRMKNREKENEKEEEEEETKGPGQGYRRQDTRNSDKKRSPRASLPEDSWRKKAATYSPALHCSTIGASGLNFSVRNGKRWNPAAITTKNNGDYRTQAKQQIHETCTSLTIKERRHMRMTHEQRPKISGN